MTREYKENEKDLRSQADKYTELNVYGDIHQLIKDRDRYKDLYREEFKKNNENKVTIESQKRLLKTTSKPGGFQSNARPSTSGFQ